MVEQFDSDELSAFIETPCNIDIFAARCRVSRRMVVYADKRSGRPLQSLLKHFPRMDNGRIQAADKDGALVDHLIFRIQVEACKVYINPKKIDGPKVRRR